MLGKDYAAQDCSLARALEVVGERWTILILRDAFYGVQRFNDFQAHLDIPKAVLSDRLSGLVEDGILQRRPDPKHGGRQLYELTAEGRDLWPTLYAMLAWGNRHRATNRRFFTHAACDTPLDEHGHCPTCQMFPAPADIISVPYGGPPRKAARTDPVAVVLRAPHRLLEPIET